MCLLQLSPTAALLGLWAKMACALHHPSSVYALKSGPTCQAFFRACTLLLAHLLVMRVMNVQA